MGNEADNRDYSICDSNIEKVLMKIISLGPDEEKKVLWTTDVYNDADLAGIPNSEIHCIFEILHDRGLLKKIHKYGITDDCAVLLMLSGEGLTYFIDKDKKNRESEREEKEKRKKKRINNIKWLIEICVALLAVLATVYASK